MLIEALQLWGFEQRAILCNAVLIGEIRETGQ